MHQLTNYSPNHPLARHNFLNQDELPMFMYQYFKNANNVKRDGHRGFGYIYGFLGLSV